MKKQTFGLLCGALVLLSSGCSASSEAQPMDPTVLVETAEVHTDTLSSNSTYIGTVSSEGKVNVVTQVSGTVNTLPVTVGSKVSAGDLLCSFDDASAQISLKNAQASYQSAQESYNSTSANYGGTDLSLLTEKIRMAQENYDANQELYEAGAVSRVELEQAQQTLNSAQAELETAQAKLNSAEAGIESAQVGIESAQYQLSLYRLTSPISGMVEAVNVSRNNYASSGTVAFVISNAQNKTVTFYVTDEVRKNLTAGQKVSVSAQNQVLEGTVSEIGSVVDSSTGLFLIKAQVNGAQNLPDGLSVSVTTASSVVRSAVIVPSDALYFEDGAAYVYLAQDGKAMRTEVEVALYTQESAAVTTGLKDGDIVITSWSASLKNETPIQLSQPEEQNAGQPADEATEDAE